ncbi:sigma factor-like helix-turn-helix DNA-binding protein [Nonomuraea soli]|uniref:DNA-directed RNA polymerase specialized sigma24 family protein n=1 Tax=Nonomuraea soli TaxID=1032476 RepID=A0A7W0HQS5_9ACTN|nr:sigma factor-like helix-turn-helix DNA-binding protein [Nonomuraea soli]MBA2892269.1 DNA-directed RNA polymerase specialized sigma24 family protein [Nonomuraea soli]
MDDSFLAERFAADRVHLTAVAYRLLGSLDDADEAVAEAWERVRVQDPTCWFASVVARVCVDRLRGAPPATAPVAGSGLSDSVQLALLVLLETLPESARLAFVLRELFAVPYEEVARILGRTVAEVEELADDARRHVRGG